MNRKNAKAKSGGVAVFVKSHLLEFVVPLKGKSENVLWFTFKNNVIISDCVIFGAVYIPPERSHYSSIDIFDVIENDIIDFVSDSNSNAKICLLGDFNAHTGISPDFVGVDDHISDVLNLDKVTRNSLNMNILEQFNIPILRYNKDKTKVDNYGKRLLSLCQGLDIFIANGRLDQDKFIGHSTCRNTTLVDYCIMSPDLFGVVSHFEILPFDPILSDVHNAVFVEFCGKSHDCVNPQNKENITTFKSKWVPENQVNFIENLNQDDLDSLKAKLESIDIDSIDKHMIDSLVGECNTLILNAAENSGMLKEVNLSRRSYDRNKSKVNKPWYNKDCHQARKSYYRAKNLHWRIRNAENRSNMVRQSKVYKKTINKCYAEYRKRFINKLKGLRSNDPKAFWSLLNRCEKSDSIMNKVSIETFFEHFKKLNTASSTDDDFNISDLDVPGHNEVLNASFTEDEVKTAIKQLKNDKACGSDLILNEFLKHSAEKLLGIFTKLFNIVFDKGIVPEDWTNGFICPIYKNKGDPASADNYRGITVLSCFSKLFTTVLNNRLNFYLESMNVLCEEQAGFRKNYSTMDHIFNLKCLIDLYLHRNKKLYCAFIDYRKAFDSVDRVLLWYKLLQHGVDGKMFNIIFGMYESAKSCVRLGNDTSEYFFSNVGVRQGENLSPVLFSLFLNDLNEFISKAYNGLSNVSGAIHLMLDNEDFAVYLRLYFLLYADDTVVLAESEAELQAALNAMFLYCKTWKLEVNESKTKVVIFCKKKIPQKPIFTYNGINLNVEDEFTYLGVLFSNNGKFAKTKKRALDQGRKAMFSIMKKSRKFNLPVDLQLHLFDTMVSPILLYGSEVWGYEDNSIIESLYLSFYKMILKVKKSTPNCIIYGELGRYPSDIFIKSRMIGFWKRIICGKKDKICSVLYKLMYELHVSDNMHFQWLGQIKNILNECGMSEYWLSQNLPMSTPLSKMVKLRLCDQYKQTWNNVVFNSPKCINYRIFKTQHSLEKYFSILPTDLWRAMCHFRCLNHKLPIERGRFWGIMRDDRLCDLCSSNQLGDEFHYIFDCSFFSSERKKFLPSHYLKRPNIEKFNALFNSEDYAVLCRLAKFCKIIISVMK